MHRIVLIAVCFATSTALLSGAAQAWTLKTLYSFGSEFPTGVIRNPATGDLYGTTINGGTYDAGTIFKITEEGKKHVLYTFSGGSDGGAPQDAPIKDDAGNLFGTTYQGGANNGGVLYRLAPDGTYTVLHNFSKGSYVFARPHLNRNNGDLYGTAAGGFDNGYVYRLTADGTYSVLYEFKGGNDGSFPYASVVTDTFGNLYGTTNYGGPRNYGTVFKITPKGEETVLHAFTGRRNGNPESGVVLDDEGNLYGTVHGPSRGNWGALFKISKDGKFEFLHHFADSDPAGSGPTGRLVMTKSGTIYGSTHFTVYEYDSDGSIQALPANGNFNSLSVKDEQGNLYGANPPTVFELVK